MVWSHLDMRLLKIVYGIVSTIFWNLFNFIIFFILSISILNIFVGIDRSLEKICINVLFSLTYLFFFLYVSIWKSSIFVFNLIPGMICLGTVLIYSLLQAVAGDENTLNYTGGFLLLSSYFFSSYIIGGLKTLRLHLR